MAEPVILFGNGANRLSNSAISWAEVLDALLRKTSYLSTSALGKPFPLLFEEIALHTARNGVGDVGSLKRDVAGLVQRLPHNEVHKGIISLPVKHILTTNYDYALEKAAMSIGLPELRASDTERKLSLFRYISLEGGQRIWHIHGEARKPASITLGYEQYAAHISGLHQHTHGSAVQKPQSPFIRRASSVSPSWLDVFLQSDVYIVGLGMGYEEIDLWWAISFKERLRVAQRPVGNTVFFQFSSDPAQPPTPISSSLMALGIEVVHVELYADWDYPLAYDRILRDIQLRIGYPEEYPWKHNKTPRPTVLPGIF